MTNPTNPSSNPGTPPLSSSGELTPGPIRQEPDLKQYGDFLEKTFEAALDAWAPGDLAEMLFQVLTSQPQAVNGEAAAAYFQELQLSAKRTIANAEEGVDHELARGIYYVAIARAWLEHDVWITRLKREEVGDGLNYLQRCQWTKCHPALCAQLAEVTKRLLA